MTHYEALSIAIAVVALIASAAALYRAGVANQLAREANDLARAQDDLAKLHLQQERDRMSKASLVLELVKHQTTGVNGRPLASYRFRLTNSGAVSARGAGFEIASNGSPLVSQDYHAKLPGSVAPGQTIDVLAAVNLETPAKLDAVVFWANPDGTEDRREYSLTW